MESKLKEKPPFWFPVAPVMVIVFIYLILLLSKNIVGWIDIESTFILPVYIRYIVGIPLMIIGLIFFIWGFAQLKPAAAIGFAQKLRDTGAYGLTRNPMYFGVNAAFWGTGIFFAQTHVIIGAFIWTSLNYLSVTLWEEKQMFSKFGDEYLEYKKRVPRFIPFKIKKNK